MIELAPEQVRALRLQAQRLEPRVERERLVEAVRAVCGVNAQLSPAMMLSLRARVQDLSAGDVQDTLAGGRTLVRTWAMRGTLHLIAADDAAWLIPLLGPAFARADRRRRVDLGLDDEKCERALREIKSILRGSGPLTRWELVDRLNERGFGIARKGQAAVHLIALAALEGIACLGPDRENGEKTFRLARYGFSRTRRSRPAALAELARRYLAGYGPASPKDFASWSGLGLTEARQAWAALPAGRTNHVRVDAEILATVSSAADAAVPASIRLPSVRLLPAFDEYLLGYADRSLVVAPEHRREVYHGGQTVPVLLVSGQAAGVWRYERGGKRFEITVRPFAPLSRAVGRLLEQEVEDIGRFWGMPAHLEITG